MRANAKRGEGRTVTEEARRAQIVEAATGVIAEVGYARASFARIAERAGLSSTGMISYHFDGKDELVERVVSYVYERAGAAIRARVAREDDASTVLRGYLESNLGFVRDNPARVRALVEIVANHRTPEGSLRYSGGDDPVLRHLEGILRAGQDAGRFREFSVRPMALVIRAAIDTASGRMVADPGFDIATYTRELVTMFELSTRKEDT